MWGLYIIVQENSLESTVQFDRFIKRARDDGVERRGEGRIRFATTSFSIRCGHLRTFQQWAKEGFKNTRHFSYAAVRQQWFHARKTVGLEKLLRNDGYYYFPNDILRELSWLWRKHSNATPQRNPIKIPQVTTGIFKTQKKTLKIKEPVGFHDVCYLPPNRCSFSLFLSR